MSYAAHCKVFGPYLHAGCRPARSTPNPEKQGFFRRYLGRLFEPGHQQIDRDIGEFLDRSGRRLTDNLEREIMQHLTNSRWRR